MKVKADRDEASPYAAMLAAQDVVGSSARSGSPGARHQDARDRRQQDQDAGPRRAVRRAARSRAAAPQDRPHRGRARRSPPTATRRKSGECAVTAPPAAAAARVAFPFPRRRRRGNLRIAPSGRSTPWSAPALGAAARSLLELLTDCERLAQGSTVGWGGRGVRGRDLTERSRLRLAAIPALSTAGRINGYLLAAALI